MVLGLREITNTSKQAPRSDASNWRGSSGKGGWNSFSSCDKKKKESEGSGKGCNKGHKDKHTQPLRHSGTGYVPPHLRGKTPPSSRSSSLSRKSKSVSSTSTKKRDSTQHLPRTMVCGPLLGVAVEIFEKAHGLNGREQESFDSLREATMAKYKCSERAFTSLVLGHSYDEVLAPLRAQVPGYITKEEARLQKQQLRQQQKAQEKSKSCQSSPSTIRQVDGEEPQLLVLNEPFSNIPSPLLFSPGALTPATSDYASDSDCDGGGTPPPERRHRIRHKQRSHTEPSFSPLKLGFGMAQLEVEEKEEEKDTREEKDEEDTEEDTEEEGGLLKVLSLSVFHAQRN